MEVSLSISKDTTKVKQQEGRIDKIGEVVTRVKSEIQFS